MIARMQFFAKAVFPFGLMSMIRDVRKSVNNEVMLTSLTGGKAKIWASIAMSYNYMSPAHVDDDAFLTALTVSFTPEVNLNKKDCYKEKDISVAVFLCFPEIGAAVALRLGDVIFFQNHSIIIV
jgi:hypothetical protein